MYCSLTEAWPEYNHNNIPTIRANGVENFFNNQVQNNSILNKNDNRPQFLNNQVTNQNNTTMSTGFNNHIKAVETFNNTEVRKVSENIIENNTDLQMNSKLNNCKLIYEHIESCEECQQFLHSRFKQNKILDVLSSSDIKETVVVFFIGLLFLMILNLLYK